MITRLKYTSTEEKRKRQKKCANEEKQENDSESSIGRSINGRFKSIFLFTVDDMHLHVSRFL